MITNDSVTILIYINNSETECLFTYVRFYDLFNVYVITEED